MSSFNVGDIVTRKSYNSDIIFRIYEMKNDISYLSGITLRIIADAPIEDLLKVSVDYFLNYQEKYILDSKDRIEKCKRLIDDDKNNMFGTLSKKRNGIIKISGKILHLDGDKDYTAKCQREYNNAGLNAVVYYITEENQPKYVQSLLKEFRPDILVITGHDNFSKRGNRNIHDMSNYRNSKYFVETVNEARKYEHAMDDLVIYAGACQSNFDALIAAGANFASSPERVLIDIMDPIIVAQAVAITPIDKVVSVNSIINSTREGIKGVGGVQTIGKYREGIPGIS